MEFGALRRTLRLRLQYDMVSGLGLRSGGESLLYAGPYMSDPRSHSRGIVLARRLDLLINSLSYFRSNDDIVGLVGLWSAHLAKS